MTSEERELARRVAGRFGKDRDDAHALIARALLEAEAELAASRAEVERLKDERKRSLDRDFLGSVVRFAWINWAKTQPNPKPSWLIPWESLAEDQREVDRQIGEAVSQVVVSPALLLAEAEIERLRRLVEEAYHEGLRDQAQHPSVDGFQLWNESDAKKALEVTT